MSLLPSTSTRAPFPLSQVNAVSFLEILNVLLAKYCHVTLFQKHLSSTFKQPFPSLPADGSEVHLPLLTEHPGVQLPHWNVSKRQGSSWRWLRLSSCCCVVTVMNAWVVRSGPQALAGKHILHSQCSYINSKACVLHGKLVILFFFPSQWLLQESSTGFQKYKGSTFTFYFSAFCM